MIAGALIALHETMTSETPCLSGCEYIVIADYSGIRHSIEHAEGCPNDLRREAAAAIDRPAVGAQEGRSRGGSTQAHREERGERGGLR